MHARLEIEFWKRGGEDVDQAKRRMLGHQVAAAFGAILPLAELGFLKHSDVFHAGRDPYRVGLPEAEGVDRAARPRPAGTAMTIAHGLRRTGDLDLDSSAKAFASQFHPRSSRSYAGWLLNAAPSLEQPLLNLSIQHVQDLLALTIGPVADVDPTKMRGLKAARLKLAKSFIVAHSHRRDMSISAVAASLNVTPRYVQRLF